MMPLVISQRFCAPCPLTTSSTMWAMGFPIYGARNTSPTSRRTMSMAPRPTACRAPRAMPTVPAKTTCPNICRGSIPRIRRPFSRLLPRNPRRLAASQTIHVEFRFQVCVSGAVQRLRHRLLAEYRRTVHGGRQSGLDDLYRCNREHRLEPVLPRPKPRQLATPAFTSILGLDVCPQFCYVGTARERE